MFDVERRLIDRWIRESAVILESRFKRMKSYIRKTPSKGDFPDMEVDLLKWIKDQRAVAKLLRQ